MFNVNSGLQSTTANGTVWIDNSDLTPIPQLAVSDADLLVVFLAPEGIYFLNRTEDPWYRATTVSRTVLAMRDGKYRLYAPDEAASPMGCVQRYQYCNFKKECGKLASLPDAADSTTTLFHLTPGEVWSESRSDNTSDATRSRFEMFQSILRSSADLTYLINTLGPSSLLSSQNVFQGLMGPLPNAQWQLDVSHWFAIHLASIQDIFLSTAHGPGEAVQPYIRKPVDDYQQEICNNQASNSSIIPHIPPLTIRMLGVLC